MKNSNIPINPFDEKREVYYKDPKDMSLEELELLLYTKRMELKLDLLRLDNKISYTKIFLDTLVALGIPEKIEMLISGLFSEPKKKSTESKPT